MKAAVIFSVPVNTTESFAWRWRSADHQRDSTQFFRFYADCAADAERNGYKVELRRIESRTEVVIESSRKRA
jgi:hypothetical protein